MSDFKVLEELFEVIKERKGSDPEASYVARLFSRGRKKIAQKVGEEAVETVIEAAANKKKNVISESGDLLFHLLVLWSEMGVTPKQVMKELEKRKGTSGVEEKRSRKK